MRHKKSISQINIERDKEVKRLYRQAQAIAGCPATIERICHIMANLPCNRFYLSDYWAVRYVKNRRNGKAKKFNNPRKQILYNAFYNTFMQLARDARYKNKDVETVVYAALMKPAPIIGLSPNFLKNVLRYKLDIYQYSK